MSRIRIEHEIPHIAGKAIEITAGAAFTAAKFTVQQMFKRRYIPTGALIGAAALGYGARIYTEPTASSTSTPIPIETRLPSLPTPTIAVGRTPIPKTETRNPSAIEAFQNKDVNEALVKYGMHAGSFFIFEPEVINKMTAYKAEQLYPIFPPAVIQQKDLIYRYAEKYHTFPNIIAILMSIESAGNPEAGSYMGAQGLMQAMPDKFPVYMQTNPSLMREPNTNVDIGVNYFANVCIPAAYAELNKEKGYPADNPLVLAKAASFYNGGPGNAYKKFDDLPDETKYYSDHVMRYILTAQVAGELRLKGYTDRQIVDALRSDEIDARAFALGEFHDRNNGLYPYEEYDKIIKLLRTPNINTSNPIYNDYLSYKNRPIFEIPLNPAVRIWSKIGGIGLLASIPANMNRNEWFSLNTGRSR